MDRKRKVLVGALVLGLISGPALALAIGNVFSSDAGAVPVAAPVTVPAVEAATTEAGPGAADDLLAACGTEGGLLVAREAAGELSDVEQAALDALRPICDAYGLALPSAATPEEETVIVETVFVSADGDQNTSVSDSEDEDEYEHEGSEAGEDDQGADDSGSDEADGSDEPDHFDEEDGGSDDHGTDS